MYSLIAAIVAPFLLIGLLVQTVRIEGFPFFGDGLQQKLADSESVNLRANELANQAIAKAREDGRVAAVAASQKLVADEIKRREATDKVLATLRATVARLRPLPANPQAPGTPGLTRPPALPVACKLDQGALDTIRITLNSQRGTR